MAYVMNTIRETLSREVDRQSPAELQVICEGTVLPISQGINLYLKKVNDSKFKGGLLIFLTKAELMVNNIYFRVNGIIHW